MELAGNIIIGIGIFFMVCGLLGLFRFNNFYARILIATKIDTVGAITLFLGIAIKHGFSFFSLKMVILMVLMVILNPLTAHIIARSAYSNEPIKEDN